MHISSHRCCARLSITEPVRDYGAHGMIAGKTGTTNDGSDVWFVGYTPNLVAAFWFGYDERHMIAYQASGGRFAAPAWAEFYMQGWNEPVAPNAWDPPPGMEYFKPGSEPRTLCLEHGAPEEAYPVDMPDQSFPQTIGKQADNLGKKIGKALGKIFKF